MKVAGDGSAVYISGDTTLPTGIIDYNTVAYRD